MKEIVFQVDGDGLEVAETEPTLPGLNMGPTLGVVVPQDLVMEDAVDKFMVQREMPLSVEHQHPRYTFLCQEWIQQQKKKR